MFKRGTINEKMNHIKTKAFKEWEKNWIRELKFWNSDPGRELLLNLMAQGYEDNVFYKMTILIGSGFSAVKIMRDLREVIDGH